MLNDHLGYMRELALVAQFASRVSGEERTLLLLFHRFVFEVMSEMALFACDASASLEMLSRRNKCDLSSSSSSHIKASRGLPDTDELKQPRHWTDKRIFFVIQTLGLTPPGSRPQH